MGANEWTAEALALQKKKKRKDMARLLVWFPEIEGSTSMHFFSGLLGGIRNERTMDMR